MIVKKKVTEYKLLLK